jgi:ABC-type sulfate transport system substrate-binding protein
MTTKGILKILLSPLVMALFLAPAAAQVKLLNVSYDPTRELYQEVNAAFVERGIGDVLLAWENEALLAVREMGERGSSRSSPRP